MYHVYLLLNKSRTRTYTGVAIDVEKRLKEHNDGMVASSRPYLPYELLHLEAYKTLKEARAKERFYKTTTGRRRLRDLIAEITPEAPMSQEEHILHELKEMHSWIAHADKQISRIKWSLWGIISMLVLVIIMLLMK